MTPPTQTESDRATAAGRSLSLTDIVSELWRIELDLDDQENACPHHAQLDRARELIGALRVRTSHPRTRLTDRSTRARAELIDAFAAPFDRHAAVGLTLTVHFQARALMLLPRRLYRRLPDRVRTQVRISMLCSPDNAGPAVWSREDDTVLGRRRLHRLDRLTRKLERRGHFDPVSGGDGRGHEWMPEEPDAYPGLDRLIVDIYTPRGPWPTFDHEYADEPPF